jgi:bacteriocin-like protein
MFDWNLNKRNLISQLQPISHDVFGTQSSKPIELSVKELSAIVGGLLEQNPELFKFL